MVLINVVDTEGREHLAEAPLGATVMEVLRPLEIGVKGECGGSVACGTCHVWVDPDWFTRLTVPSEDEQAVLDGERHVTPHSRLCCQIQVESSLDGMRLTMPSPPA